MVFRRYKIDYAKEYEILFAIIPLIVQMFFAQYAQRFEFMDGQSIRWIPIAISLSPVLLIYLLLKLIIPSILSVLIVSFTIAILSIINKIKLSLANAPLVWNDLSTFSNISLVGHYFNYWHALVVVLFVFFCILSCCIYSTRKITKKYYALHLSLCLAITPFATFPYVNVFNEKLESTMSYASKKAGVNYIFWNWGQNIQRNGLPLHLVQTSRRTMPAAPTETQRRSFDYLKNQPSNNMKRPKNIIVILFEAGWHDDANFKNLFSEFEKIGLVEFRAIAPVYGGNTVNSSFELLTGLPSRGVLKGVIYQEYTSLISDNAETFPRYLHKVGYSTIAAHNHYKSFWQRNIIMPKFGFNKFLGLEDMAHGQSLGWADDSVLFDAAIEELNKNISQSHFLFLTTVFTHGDFKFNDDYGEQDYAERLSVSIKRISEFILRVKALEEDTLILVAADHKPALTRYFYEKGVLGRDQFSSIGERNEDFIFSLDSSMELIGDVPAYIYYHDSAKIYNFIKKANNEPYFCVAQALDEEFTNVGVPAFVFSKLNSICNNNNLMNYDTIVANYPDWIYSLSIFD